MAQLPELDNRSYAEVFGHSPVDDYFDIPEWRTERRAALAPTVDAQINYDAMTRQNEYNRALAIYQNEYNTEMWERQNEYNSPANTMKRLVEAGINPRAYQQIGQFANAGPQQPAASYNYKEPMSETAKYVESENLKLQRKQYRLANLQLMNDILNETFQYKINQDRNEEAFRHNTELEGIKRIAMGLDYDKFRYALVSQGIGYDYDTHEFTFPIGYKFNLDNEYKQQMLDNLKKSGVKLETENDYLNLKKSLESIKTGNQTLDTIVKILKALL